jgi:hypothetical protein
LGVEGEHEVPATSKAVDMRLPCGKAAAFFALRMILLDWLVIILIIINQ